MEINCLIVDDEQPAVDELNFILSEIANVNIVGSADSAENAIRMIGEKQPDLVFLDIKMPGRDGFEVVKACASFHIVPFFVFATAYDEHAVAAFDAGAIDYILKPFQADRVKESVDRVRQLLVNRRKGVLCGQLEKLVGRIQPSAPRLTKISVEHKGRILLLEPESIVYCRAKKKGILAYIDGRAYKIHSTVSLDHLESKLKGCGFFRCHRSYLVNLVYVKEVIVWFNGKYILTMSDQKSTEVPVSRRRSKALKQRLGL